jgi:hypothetical protein
MKKLLLATLLVTSCFSSPLQDCIGKILQNKQEYQKYKQTAVSLYNSSDQTAKAQSYSEYLKLKEEFKKAAGIDMKFEDMLAIGVIKIVCATELGIKLDF